MLVGILADPLLKALAWIIKEQDGNSGTDDKNSFLSYQTSTVLSVPLLKKKEKKIVYIIEEKENWFTNYSDEGRHCRPKCQLIIEDFINIEFK